MAGVKPKFTSSEAMQQLIDQYFEDCGGRPLLDDDGKPVLDKWGRPIVIGDHPPTVTGLALALGFHSRQSLLNYQGKRQFMDTITRAKTRVEEYAERRLYDRDGARGAEFNLRYNFKWSQEEKENGGGTSGVVLLSPVMEGEPSPSPPAAAAAPPEEEPGGGQR